MTTTSLTPPAARAPRARLLRGTHWTVVRLHRATLWTAFALVVLAAAVTGYLRLAFDGRPGFVERVGLSDAHDLLYTYLDRGTTALLFLPLAVAVFSAGPVVARELESGVHKFAWTQGHTPARWLSARLTLTAAVAVAAGLAVLGGFRIGGSGLVHADGALRWPDSAVYTASGPVVVAYCLLGAAVGALAGLLLRRTLLAMTAAATATGAVLWILTLVRWDLFPARTRTDSSAAARDAWVPGGIPDDAYVTDQGVINSAGQRFSPGQCPTWDGPAPGGSSCPADTGVAQAYADYHPRSHFWYVQLIETGIVLALAAAATYGAFWILRRRTP
ncbi:hypothetical protein [Streptomyces silvensis]|uniref:ABC transporter permease n=1 Tax=Streptomyces silvensis TaxID=1765722 RepID=A0A0W7XB31_9ACTN|nr:hypothetical protein [Streptomyces silvensis]KUF19860.1 hypothetical protein AT728_05930 [Streptomyces silvensis]